MAWLLIRSLSLLFKNGVFIISSFEDLLLLLVLHSSSASRAQERTRALHLGLLAERGAKAGGLSFFLEKGVLDFQFGLLPSIPFSMG